MERNGPTVVRLERLLLAWLVRGEKERFELPPAAEAPLSRALHQVLAGSEAWSEVERCLKLAVALEQQLQSPSAAARLRAVLRSAPAAVALIRRRLLKVGAIDEVREFREREDRGQRLCAPKHDALGPRQGYRLADFLDPAGGRGVPKVVRFDAPPRLSSSAGALKER